MATTTDFPANPGNGHPFGKIGNLPSGVFATMDTSPSPPSVGLRVVSDRIWRYLLPRWRQYRRAILIGVPNATPPQLAPSRRHPYVFFTDIESLANGELPEQFARRVELSDGDVRDSELVCRIFEFKVPVLWKGQELSKITSGGARQWRYEGNIEMHADMKIYTIQRTKDQTGHWSIRTLSRN